MSRFLNSPQDLSFIPDNEKGSWYVKTFHVGRGAILSQVVEAVITGRYVPEGVYKALHHKSRGVIMSNTRDELRDIRHYRAKIAEVSGSVLINGLGLGICVVEALKNPNITDITVIEIEQDVIDLIAPHIKDERLSIIHHDCFTYKPPKDKRYQVVWHDIWDNICGDNLKEMTKLHRKYSGRCDWQDSWAKSLCQRVKRIANKQQKYDNIPHVFRACKY